VQADNNLLVNGSSVVGDNTVALGAGNNVDIVAATNTDSSWRFKEEKKSGLMGTGGIGFSIGSSKTTTTCVKRAPPRARVLPRWAVRAVTSRFLPETRRISAVQMIAGRDIRITGDSVVIDPGHDKRTVDEV
jgi:filamentous hemagglutinin